MHPKEKVQLIDARNYWVPMEKSLGNKRRRIGDPTDERPKDPSHIADLTSLHGQFSDGASRWVLFDKSGKVATVSTTAPTAEAPEGQTWKELVVSKVFANADFGFHKITVERPLRLNFLASAERVARLELESAFKNLAASNKKNEAARREEIEAGEKRQEEIRTLLQAFAEAKGDKLYKDRTAFLLDLRELDRRLGVRLSAPEIKAVLSALGERDETAEICKDKSGNPEPDADLRDTESVPLTESIEEYFQREVLPHVPDAWIDHTKTKTGYEIPLNRHFYRYEPPRPLEVIEAEIKTLEGEIITMLSKVTA